jgi:hypothetical protein
LIAWALNSFQLRADIEPDKVKVSAAAVEATRAAIRNRVPVIMNACFSCQSGIDGVTIQGVADMLVLNVYVDHIFGGEYCLGREDMYCVVKIKYSTIDLRADGTYLLNNDKQKVYKAQSWLLNKALAKEQGYLCPQSYVIGRKYQYTQRGTKHNIGSAFGKLGVIDFNEIDAPYNQMGIEAIEWLKYVRTPEVAAQDPLSPGISELFPNMKKPV